MTSRSWKRRALLLGGCAGAAALAFVLLRSNGAPAPARPLATAPETEPAAPAQHRRDDFAWHADPSQPVPAEAPPAAAPVAAAGPLPPPSQILVGDGRTLPPQSGAGWATEFRDAVCACSTRTCVSDLQAAFIRKLDTVRYDDARDATAYSEAARAAVRCFTALPEQS